MRASRYKTEGDNWRRIIGAVEAEKQLPLKLGRGLVMEKYCEWCGESWDEDVEGYAGCDAGHEVIIEDGRILMQGCIACDCDEEEA